MSPKAIVISVVAFFAAIVGLSFLVTSGQEPKPAAANFSTQDSDRPQAETSQTIFDIYAVDLGTEKVTNLTNDERYDTAPVASPDGTQLVYVGNDGDFNHLFTLDLADLSKKQITFNRYNDSSPSWSDDSKKIVFTSDDDIKPHINNAYEYEKELPAKVIFLRGFGHFTLDDMGTEEFSELLKEILDDK